MEKIDKLFITVAIICLIILIISRIKERREDDENDPKNSLASSPKAKKENNQLSCCKKICKTDIHCMDNCLQQPIEFNKNIGIPYEVNGIPSSIPQFVDAVGPSCPQCNNSKYYSYGCNNCEKCRYRSANSKIICSSC